MSIKTRLFKLAIPMALLGMVGCSRNETEPVAIPTTGTEKTLQVDLHIEGAASMELDEARAGGGLQLKYAGGTTPLFRMTSDDAEIEANCVFKPLKKGSRTELDDARALYGKVVFRREAGSEASMTDDGKAVAVKLKSKGPVTLKGNTSIMPGEEWYIMGMVGGSADADGKNIKVDGFTIAAEENGTYTGLDALNDKYGSAPFLSKWVKLAPVEDPNKLLGSDPIHFKFQGILFALDMKNGTNYNLKPTFLQLQSTELTAHVSYDLSSSNSVTDTEDKVKWINTGNKDATDRWYITWMSLGDKYHLDPKNSATSFLYDKSEPNKYKATVIFWANAIDTDAIKRTGFFVSSTNTEAKPAWTERRENGSLFLDPNTDKGTHFKYVLTPDANLDGILQTRDNHAKLNGQYASDIQMAPGMDFLCVRAIQRSLKNNRGKYVHLTVTVPERPVMPIETMAQNNLYNYQDGKYMNFVYFPGTENRYGYQQYGYYAKEFAEYSDANKTYWMLPTLKQWHGLTLQGHNLDNAHNWNEGVYDWIEGEGGDFGKESIEFSNGVTKEYYATYGRPAKGANDNKIYGLRFFADKEHKVGTDQFSLTRYELRQYEGHPVLAIESVWLGPEYAKLYDGVFTSVKDWIKEIAQNDNGGEKSMFRRLRRDFVTRYLLVEQQSGATSYKDPVPKGYTPQMVGYFYGPATNFPDKYTAKAIAFKNNTLFTGPSNDLKYDFTNFTTSRFQVQGFIRPIRRNFTTFQYK